jgi:hypothetical protein
VTISHLDFKVIKVLIDSLTAAVAARSALLVPFIMLRPFCILPRVGGCVVGS